MALLDRAVPEVEPKETPRRAPAAAIAAPALVALVSGFVALYGALVVVKYRFYLYRDFDLAIFTQALERILAGSTVTSIRGMSWLGDHASYVLFLLAPLYAIARHPLFLPMLQTVVLGLGAIPVFRMALAARTGHETRSAPSGAHATIALAMAAAYLLQPALGYLDLFEFHPETIATTALLFGIDAWMSRRLRACALWTALALATREDVALVVLAFGAWTLIFGRGARPRIALVPPRGAAPATRAPAFGLALIAMGLASLFVTFALIRPRFGTAGADYLGMYGGLGTGPLEIVANLARHPWLVAQGLITTPDNPLDAILKLELWVHLLLPLAFLPLLAPSAWLVALPILAEHLLSRRIQQHTIVFQYTALVLPVLAWAAILGLRRLRDDTARAAAFGAVAAALVAQIAFGPIVGRNVFQTSRATERVFPNAQDRVLAKARDAMLARVPAEGAVVASFEFLPRLARRHDVHSLHHVLRGAYTYSTRPYPELVNVTAVLADWDDPMLRRMLEDRSARVRVQRLIESNRLVPIAGGGNLYLYTRAEDGAPHGLSAGSASPSRRRAPPP